MIYPKSATIRLSSQVRGHDRTNPSRKKNGIRSETSNGLMQD